MTIDEQVEKEAIQLSNRCAKLLRFVANEAKLHVYDISWFNTADRNRILAARDKMKLFGIEVTRTRDQLVDELLEKIAKTVNYGDEAKRILEMPK